jgi:hypothetical protein
MRWWIAFGIAVCVSGCGEDSGSPGTGGSGGSAGGLGSGGSVSGSGGSSAYCQPTGPTLATLGASAVTIDQAVPGGLGLSPPAANAAGVYWYKDPQGILRVAPGSTTPEVVVAGAAAGPLVSASAVYWVTSTGELWRAPLASLPATGAKLADGVPTTSAFYAADEANFYFSDLANHRIMSLPVAGGTATEFLPNVDVAAMTLHGGYVYYVANRIAYRIAYGATTPEPISPMSDLSLTAIATDGTTLFWADQDTLKQTPISSPTQESTLGEADFFDSLQLSGTRVYYQESRNPTVGWFATDGSSCGLAVADSSIIGTGFVVDEQHVYFVLGSFDDERLVRVPK